VSLGLLLFSTRPELIRPAVAGGVDGVIVDWERIGKEARQRGADTCISSDTHEDLLRVREATSAPVICRLDGPGPWTAEDVRRAADAGADEVLLPMVRTTAEVEAALAAAAGRCGVGILIETREALPIARDLAALALTRIYIGLNDLSIELGTPSLFTAFADGTVERIREAVAGVPLGFGGMTLPDRGHPIPARLILGELMRLRADFTFLRRSFWNDVEGMDAAEAIRAIRAAADAAAARGPEQVEADRRALREALAVAA
jgi:hypothetical protein